MINELLQTIVNTTINSFDFPYCIVVNIATYTVIQSIQEIKPNLCITTWLKRLIMFVVAIFCGIVYYQKGCDIKVIFNSIILAPVSWSWIFKPICSKLNIDYKSIYNNKDIKEQR